MRRVLKYPASTGPVSSVHEPLHHSFFFKPEHPRSKTQSTHVPRAMSASLRRIARELEELQAASLDSIGVASSADPHTWHAYIKNSRGIPFFLQIVFPDLYPFKPPSIVFTTPVRRVQQEAHVVVASPLPALKWRAGF